ncbi:hypothetical protein [Serratia marcescens]|uniref:hypothetical protein n=1 Tax=Serratia marcescens TaxID=615 RepID=UPI000DFCA61C|nr:hypothetical protein [Serratia marcescens]SUI52046.1 Uncharacterised protein [Serratia marcescens]
MLTTERQQFEEWLKFHSDEEECTNLLQRNSAGTNYLHPHADLAWIAWQASRELLANREAQPVEYGDAYQGAREDLSIWKRRALEAEDKMRHLEKINDHLVKEAQGEHRMGEPILTAPPAPANAQQVAWEMRYWNSGHNMWHDWERITAEQHAEMSAEHATSNDYEFRVLYDAPPAPAVTDESDPRDAFESVFPMPKYVVRCGTGYAVTAYSAWGAHDFKERWEGWNACRAAMLAQPVSGGYTLNSPVIPDGWKPVPVEPTKEMINAALAAGCASIRSAYREMLAAAPATPSAPDDLIMQVRRLVHALKKSNPDHALVKQVPDYMRRAGYWKLTDCLRGAAAAPEGGNDHDTRR